MPKYPEKEQKNGNLIVLMTDFGLKDPFVGMMKGVIATIAPTCTPIDLTHGIQPQDILQASFLLSISYPYFPAGTPFVSVVDPGVGTDRRPVLVQAFDAYFIGPDNGIFGFLNRDPNKKIICLQNDAFFRTPVSRTFHGRDIFAPIAAHLIARGPEIIPDLGEDQTAQPLKEPEGWYPTETPEGMEGTVVHIDRFGNLLTNLHARHLSALTRRGWNIQIVFRHQGLPFLNTFAEAPADRPCALIGSSSYLEIFIRNGHAGKTLHAHTGEKVYVKRNHR